MCSNAYILVAGCRVVREGMRGKVTCELMWRVSPAGSGEECQVAEQPAQAPGAGLGPPCQGKSRKWEWPPQREPAESNK